MTKAFLFVALLAAPSAAETFKIDAAHSGVSFRVTHMVVSKVAGRFDRMEGSIDYVAGKPKEWKVDAVIDAASINTNHPDRDAHLRNADFLDVPKHPKITFKSTKVTDVKGMKAKLHGDFTMHGVTKPVVLDLEIGGVIKDHRGNQRLGAVATTRINRMDYGVAFSKVMEGGGLMVGHDVDVTLEIEAIVAKPEEK